MLLYEDWIRGPEHPSCSQQANSESMVGRLLLKATRPSLPHTCVQPRTRGSVETEHRDASHPQRTDWHIGRAGGQMDTWTDGKMDRWTDG